MSFEQLQLWYETLDAVLAGKTQIEGALCCLVGLQRRNRKDIPPYLEQAMARDDWQECPVGITASEEREQYEGGMRELSMERTRKELEGLRR